MKTFFVFCFLLFAGVSAAQPALSIYKGGTGSHTAAGGEINQVGDTTGKTGYVEGIKPGGGIGWIVSGGSITTPISIANGGTNGTTAVGAYKNLTPDSTNKTLQVVRVKAGGGYEYASQPTVKSYIVIPNLSTANNQWSEMYANGGTDATDPTDTSHQSSVALTMGAAGTLKNLFIQVDGIGCTGDTVIGTIYQNGSATAIVAAINGHQFNAVDNTHSISVSAGDLIAIKWKKIIGPGCVSAIMGFWIEFDPN